MKSFRVLIATLALFALGVAPAMAATSYVGGGTWNHGNRDGRVYSEYHNPSKYHRASVVNGYGHKQCRQAKAGFWARASLKERPWVTDQAYWANKPCNE